MSVLLHTQGAQAFTMAAPRSIRPLAILLAAVLLTVMHTYGLIKCALVPGRKMWFERAQVGELDA